ncbi:C45 family peptidase [Streptomyces sp. NBC_00083]|uniref:C45 family autoproteolytic acyltransferase/hydolase n=1 Tax=Streptomyces sp. NBC_00083 TaxID=2975647 RepID=UPI0022530238|nr:C45 family peptidase [Streptomyces sp. NBC_00083]MCX5386211.1 C45 family autoproteolytic acyltransferase/hydrolase [Streptomyces sp. NBC_00083]
MTDGAGVAHLRLSGTPYEVGRQHGTALAGSLRGFVDDSLCRLNLLLDEQVSMAGLHPVLSAFDAVITAELPRLAEEITGLADGIGIPRDQALLLQLRREILGYRKIPARGDCTTYARAGSHPVLAQTVDLNGDLDDRISVLDIGLEGSPRRALVLSFAGLLGYLGVNSDGLAVGLNLVLGGDWKPGVPPYLAIRHVLDCAGGVDEAVEFLRGLPLASSRSFMLCDADKAVWVEALDGEFRCFEAQQAEHTNHFLHPDFQPSDEINVFARNSSRRRLEACRAGLAAMAPAAGVEDHFALLSAPPIRVAATGDIRYERTVAAAVALPGSGRLYLRPGDPAACATREFTVTDPGGT